MNEKEVLAKLDIPDFWHMTKDKVVSFDTMLPSMDSGVAEKALGQFPEFAKTIIELATDYKDLIDKELDGNSESTKACHDVCTTIIESLQKQLDNEGLSFEERKYYIDKMGEMAQMMQQKDSENKMFILKVAGIAGATVVFLAGTASAVLGSNVTFKLPGSKS